MTDEDRKDRKEFIARLHALMHRKGMTQLVLSIKLRIGEKNLGAMMNADLPNQFPAFLLSRAAADDVLGPEVFACIPGCENLVITTKPTPVCNVEPVSAVCVPALMSMSELATKALDAMADGKVDRQEQAGIDLAADKVHRATQVVSSTTRAAVPTRGGI